MSDKVKVLVVDDSLMARKYLSKILEGSGKVEVIGTAVNGLEALEKVKLLKPDVVTLDIEMPKMNGLEALEKIMKECPVPVIMISTLTRDGAHETLKALHLGAVDYISKNDVLSLKSAQSGARDIFVEKVVSAKHSSFSGKRTSDQKVVSEKEKFKMREAHPVKRRERKLQKENIKLLAIASSTGGPIALEKLFSKLPKLNIPVLIVQHMPKAFTGVFANSLDKISSMHVKEAEDGEELKANVCYLAPGGLQMTISKVAVGKYRIKISDKPKTIYTPNANITFESAANEIKNNLLSVIMTGMGDDGYKGLQVVNKNGGIIIAQSKGSCVVWGMPKKPTESGIADFVVDLNEIHSYISKIVLGR